MRADVFLGHALRQRDCQPEVQDRLDLDSGSLTQALRGLARINAWSRATRTLWRPLEQWMRQRRRSEVSILDLGCGAGDHLIALCQRARHQGYRVHAAGCDRNPRAVEYAQQQADQAHVAVRFFSLDIPHQPAPECYDVVMCSLLLHHMTNEQVVPFLHWMSVAAKELVIVHDLRRSAFGLCLAYGGTRLLGCGPVNRIDSVLSVRAALTVAEARAFACQAGWTEATVQPCWPCRWLMTWRKP